MKHAASDLWHTRNGFQEAILSNAIRYTRCPHGKHQVFEAHRDGRVVVVDAEQQDASPILPFDTVIKQTADILAFSERFYAGLVGPGNQIALRIEWGGMLGKSIDKDDIESANWVIKRYPKKCTTNEPIVTSTVQCRLADAEHLRADHVHELTGYLFGAFGFDMKKDVLLQVLQR